MSRDSVIGGCGIIASVSVAEFSHAASIMVSFVTLVTILPAAFDAAPKICGRVKKLFVRTKK